MFVVERIRRLIECGRCALRSPSILLNQLAKLSLRSVIGFVKPATSFRYRGHSNNGWM